MNLICMQYVYILQMGALASLRGNRNQQQYNNNQVSQNSRQQIAETAFGIWQRSSKTINDYINYIQSQQSHQDNHDKALLFISSIVNRQKLYGFLHQIQAYVLNIKQGQNKCKLSERDRRKIISIIHPKLANIFFVWNQLSSPNLTPSMVHDRILAQMSTSYSYSQKLIILYTTAAASPGLPLHASSAFIDPDTMIKQAVRINYPYLITKQTIHELFEHIMQISVFIEDTIHFCKFIKNIIQQTDTKKGVQTCKDYAQRLFSIYSTKNQDYQQLKLYLQKLSSQNNQSTKTSYLLLQAGRQFLQIGYPHGMQLIFQSVLQIPQSYISDDQLRLYLYTRMYSLFAYWLEDINLQFRHVQKMTINNIMHLMLRNGNIDVLNKLIQIFEDVDNIQNNRNNSKHKQWQIIYNFQDQLCNYIFSTYCSLQLCLQIITNKPPLISINSKYPQRQQKLLSKISESKFQVIIQNQQLIKSITQQCLSSSAIFKQFVDKIQQILQIIRLLYMFGVNQKFNNIIIFYCPQIQINYEQERIKQIQIIQQDKALYIFKAFISKYYISNTHDKNKKIMLNSKTNNPINIDLNKSQSILQISQFLYDKLLKKGLRSIKQIHQIIFQHMIYFYRYDDAKNILTNQTFINKYSINIEMLEMIVIDNIIEYIKKTNDSKKIINDVNQQLKLIKNNQSIQAQGAKAMVRLITYLSQNGIQLTIQQKQKMNISLMYNIIQNYSDRIDVLNFDTIYQEIRIISSNQHMQGDQKYMMTNQLLKFKSKLAAKAFETGKKKLGNQLIDEISRFDPPWLTTQLIQIFHNSNSKIDKRIYGIAMKSCSKGSDLKYLMELWKQQQGKQRRKQKGFAQITEYFQTGRQYLIIDDSLIQNQQKYRNYVAQCQFSDSILHVKKYQLFFVLLGSEPDRAFHYALKTQLDPFKIDTFLKQAMKTNIINAFNCVEYLQKYLFYAYKVQQQKLKPKDLPTYSQYLKEKLKIEDLRNSYKKIHKIKDKSIIGQIYLKALSAYLFSKVINQRFINTYFSNSQDKGKSNLIFELLFDQNSRKNLFIGLREQPMGRSDIFILNDVCNQLGISLLQLSLFNLGNIANTSQQLDEKSQNIMQKIITISSDKKSQCKQIVSKLIQKIFSIRKLHEILSYIKQRENHLYKEIIKDKNLYVLQQLGSIQLGQQFHGIIPINFFQQQIKVNPAWPISQEHEKVLKRCLAKTNIYVVSKVMYFVYGMNPKVQKKIWTDYLKQNPDDQLRQIMQKILDHQ